MKKFPRINNEDGINTLCRMTTELEYDDIPAEVIELAKELSLDTVGCMIGGHGQHPLPELAHHLQKKGGVEEAYIMFHGGKKIPAEEAAMAMGPMPRALDWAAIHPEAMHSVEHTLPPMLCTLGYLDSTEGRRVSGKEFLTAFVAAQETLIRIGIGYRGNIGVQRGRSNGHYIFGSVAGVGKLMRLDQAHLENAEGIGRNMTQPHDMATYHPITHMVKVHQGFIAQDAIQDCKFAKLGVTGPRNNVICGPMGYFGMANWETNTDILFDKLGEKWEQMGVEMKAYAGCKCLHCAVGAAEYIVKQNGLTPEDVEHIHVEDSTLNVNVSGGTMEEKLNPKDIFQRQFSVPYMVATMLYDGELIPQSFFDEPASRQYIKDFMQKVDIVENPDLVPWRSKVTLTTKDGRTFVKEMDPIELKGSVEHRYTREELIHKFKTLSKMSITEFPEGTLDTLIDNILNLEKSDDVLRDIVFTLTPNRE